MAESHLYPARSHKTLPRRQPPASHMRFFKKPAAIPSWQQGILAVLLAVLESRPGQDFFAYKAVAFVLEMFDYSLHKMLFSAFLFASTASATCLHGLSMFKRSEEAEGDVEVKTFGYGPLNGPFNWASLGPENEACKSGANQSPINIDDSVTVMSEKPSLNIPPQEVEFENLGTTIEIIVNGTTTVAGSDFQLVQFHMHTPSEHHLNGEYHPLEVHMVHQGVADPTQLAVIALMFQVSAGESSSIIRSLSGSISAISTPGSKTTLPSGIDFRDVEARIAESDVLQYTGSLTTPPCAEGVTFMIVRDPLHVSVADFNAIKAVVKFNARFIQNSLGTVNMLEVGSVAGTAGALHPLGLEGEVSPLNGTVNGTGNGTANGTVNATANATEPERAMSVGQRFTITELHGLPTKVPAVVVARKRKY
ncbi:alpha carbonic anhydrase [Ampelomyces quisqualis]|uniref:Carbonic anhydrase n=1 Tax=Ampelomyces quisqualis TaxID=50730 RepID=A0A6A5QE28_AMPQU|nr:alpha carbonic anhydrase [Ampelomyces quisqualis]